MTDQEMDLRLQEHAAHWLSEFTEPPVPEPTVVRGASWWRPVVLAGALVAAAAVTLVVVRSGPPQVATPPAALAVATTSASGATTVAPTAEVDALPSFVMVGQTRLPFDKLVPIDSVAIGSPGDTTVDVGWTRGCGDHREVFVTAQDSHTVTLATASFGPVTTTCIASGSEGAFEIDLGIPLNGRTVIDASDGSEIEVVQKAGSPGLGTVGESVRRVEVVPDHVVVDDEYLPLFHLQPIGGVRVDPDDNTVILLDRILECRLYARVFVTSQDDGTVGLSAAQFGEPLPVDALCRTSLTYRPERIELGAPLGDRRIIDDTTHAEVLLQEIDGTTRPPAEGTISPLQDDDPFGRLIPPTLEHDGETLEWERNSTVASVTTDPANPSAVLVSMPYDCNRFPRAFVTAHGSGAVVITVAHYIRNAEDRDSSCGAEMIGLFTTQSLDLGELLGERQVIDGMTGEEIRVGGR
ncbi:hypothetical protein GIS00_01665 [Nakamurella sp. YIM 132087]|uniref:Uncharacterized protein n=1 Tax=Nakamurella alba TaxID=2665158 RepID=A0A7K1FEX1_9ACTN|nr:hypothetical protein [Nakamurella alba]MTD12652.1 hypothetical protein [Nakamurella alba]